MTRLARFNVDIAPLLVPLLMPAGALMAWPDEASLSAGGWLGLAAVVPLLALALYWRRRARRAAGGLRPGLAVACWVFAGLTSMLLHYKMLWGLAHVGGPLAEGRDVASRAAQTVVFYAVAAWLSTRSTEGGAEPRGERAV